MKGHEGELGVPFRPTRAAQFTAEQRWALLLEYDQCLEHGAKSAFCRRVGIDPWTMRDWVKKRAAGQIVEPEGRSSGSSGKRVVSREDRDELRRLRHENERLRRELEQARTAAEILGKAAAFLEGLAKNAEQSPPVPGMPAWLRDPSTSSLPQIPSRDSQPKPE